MTVPALSHPCIVFALQREALFFRRAFPRQANIPGAPCLARYAESTRRTVLMLEMGMGTTAVDAALAWALSGPTFDGMVYRPRVVVSAGFSGALVSDLGVGDLVLADEVVDTAGNRWPIPWPGSLPPGPWHRGRLLTTPGLVADPEEKYRLGQQHQALAVDMESAAVARLCHQHGLPFGCLRAISDDWNTPLSPRLAHLLEGGRVRPLRLLGGLLRRPPLAGELWRLARHTRRAAQQLSLGLGELLTRAQFQPGQK